MKRKRIEAWVCVDESGEVRQLSEEKLLKAHFTWREVRLVEAEPAADAVVRAAIAWCEDKTAIDIRHALVAAVERLEKARARRGR